VTDSKHAFAGEVVLEQGKYTWEFLEDQFGLVVWWRRPPSKRSVGL
jgi:hypothetical protein